MIQPVLVGFQKAGRSETEEAISLSWAERIPDQASTLAFLLDTCVAADQRSYNNLRIELEKGFERGIKLFLCLGPGAAQGVPQSVSAWIQVRLGFQFSVGGPWRIRSSLAELHQFFREHLAFAAVSWSGSAPAGIQTIAVAQNDQGEDMTPCCIRFSYGKSDIWIVPIGPEPTDASAALTFISRTPSRLNQYPGYLDALPIGDELTIQSQIGTLQGQIEEAQERLEAAHKMKQVLFFSGLDLEHEVVRFLTEELEIPARHVSGTNEDFQLVDAESKAEWAIGEVKGFERRNVARSDVAALMFHRQEAGFTEELPGLLVANTFHRLEDLGQRDQPISEDVCRLSSDSRIVVVRTLDLVRLRLLLTEAREAFVSALKESGGWFEVGTAGSFVLHRR